MSNTINFNWVRVISAVLLLIFYLTASGLRTGVVTTQSFDNRKAGLARTHKDFGFLPPKLADKANLYWHMHPRQIAGNVLLPAALEILPTPNKGGSPDRESQVLIYDAGAGQYLPGVRARFEGSDSTSDDVANKAYDYHVAMRMFLSDIFDRNSFDDKGSDLPGSVHFNYKDNINNAGWNGHQMVYGDGDGKFFNSFVRLDVVGHEIFHAVTETTSNLDYQGQPGALNEHLSDVSGVLFRQWRLNLTADKDTWLLGEGLFTNQVNGRALRDMRFPGTAFNDPFLGRDTQPAHMKDFVVTMEDDGGVHDNSGIPNRAFAMFAIAVGGKAWKTAGHIWFAAATNGHIPRDCDFQRFADETTAVCAVQAPAELGKLKAAWAAVGIKVG